MEPYIRDGDRVFVQRDVTLTDGDVGIFFVDGDVYCKQICQDNYRNIYLLSANPKREDANLTIRSDSARSFVCFGKVLLPRRLPMPVYD
jgi:phage repressor protein C with HTH and peptisase S24 domain